MKMLPKIEVQTRNYQRWIPRDTFFKSFVSSRLVSSRLSFGLGPRHLECRSRHLISVAYPPNAKIIAIIFKIKIGYFYMPA